MELKRSFGISEELCDLLLYRKKKGENIDRRLVGCVRLTQVQHKPMIKNPWITPAVPMIHVIRMKRITPKMFCKHGKKTPVSVPSFGASLACLSGASGSVGAVTVAL